MISRVPETLNACRSPVCRCSATTLPGSRRISSDQPSSEKRSGRNDLPGPVSIHGMLPVSIGRAGSVVT
jgi:hypothetical protein